MLKMEKLKLVYNFIFTLKQSVWNQGFGLGGSGMLNSMVYLRGHPYDYDSWAFWVKDKRWKYRNVLPYFLKSEDYCFECEKQSTLRTPTKGTIDNSGYRFSNFKND